VSAALVTTFLQRNRNDERIAVDGDALVNTLRRREVGEDLYNLCVYAGLKDKDAQWRRCRICQELQRVAGRTKRLSRDAGRRHQDRRSLPAVGARKPKAIKQANTHF